MALTIEHQAFSDGRTLTQWLVAGGAPALPPGIRYRLIFGSAGGATKITAQIISGRRVLGEYTTFTRVSAAMAAVSAATYAHEDLYQND